MGRKFSAEGVMHIYQRTISGFNLFYSLEDFLVFYTIVSIQVRKFGICLLGMCMMIDHLHLLASAANLMQMAGFISAYTSLYVREFNAHTGRTGPLFEPLYGSAMKMEMKKIRSAIIYMFNNAVEKRLCPKAEDYRWNFLKYYNPEKTRPIRRKKDLSRRLQRALKITDNAYKSGEYLRYALLKRLYKGVDSQERELLTDYIITLYFPFRKDMPCKYFKSYQDMVTAVNSNTGSEYDIIEKHYCKSDVPYREMTKYLKRKGITDAKTLISESDEVKQRYFTMLRENTSGTAVQVRKFLHIHHHAKGKSST